MLYLSINCNLFTVRRYAKLARAPFLAGAPLFCVSEAGKIAKIWQVLFNGERLPIKSFAEYVGMYLGDKSVPRVHEKVNDRWEVIIAASQGQFQQVKFVNAPSACYMTLTAL